MTNPAPTAASTPEAPKRDLIDRIPDALKTTNTLFGALVFIGGVASALRTTTKAEFATALAWSLGSAVSGSAIGFLFGIPKILQGDFSRVAPAEGAPRDAPPSYRQQVNTNLTEISDWLTKIIVGLGLINLSKIPGQLHRVGGIVAAGLATAPGKGDEAFAVALIVGYTTTGFLFGYISTRLFLAGEFSKADQAALLTRTEQRIATNETAIASLASSAEVLKQAVFPAHAAAPVAGAGAGGGPPQAGAAPAAPVARPVDPKAAEEALLALAKEYLDIRIPDYSARVGAKDEAANRMAKLILESSLSTEAVAELYRRERNEGLVLALATVINLRPGPGDFGRLLSVAPGIARLHVRYRVLVALSELTRRGLATPADLPRVRALLEEYQRGADASLKELITSVRATFEKALG